MKSEEFIASQMSGRNRRLLHEWKQLEQGLEGRSDLKWHITKRNCDGLPVGYHIDYYIHSLKGVTNVEWLNEPGVANEPLFADHFQMEITLPVNYPCVDAPPMLSFRTTDEHGKDIAHPWHPNIRYFGTFAGHVCINMADTYTDLLWAIRRVASYLRYETYHATLEPPYPEDLQVAAWVRCQGEPLEWIYFDHQVKKAI